MAAHKGPAGLRPRCTRGGSSVAAVPVNSLQPIMHLCSCVFLGHLRDRGSFPSKDTTSLLSSAVEAQGIKGDHPPGIKRPGYKTNFLHEMWGSRMCGDVPPFPRSLHSETFRQIYGQFDF
jgi:hypothetical protein